MGRMEVVEEDTGMREGPERQLERRHNDEGPKFADYASRRARVEDNTATTLNLLRPSFLFPHITRDNYPSDLRSWFVPALYLPLSLVLHLFLLSPYLVNPISSSFPLDSRRRRKDDAGRR